MTRSAENGRGWSGFPWRIAGWGGVALTLLLPLVAMQFSDDENWTVFDFGFAATILIGTGLALELAVRQSGDTAYRAAAGLALAGALLLVWITGAVGIIGNEDNNANVMYCGVLLIGIIGGIIARFGPGGMARALFAAAFAQGLVGAIALAGGGFGSTDPNWALDVVGLTGFFVALFAASAVLFQQAAERGAA